MAYTPVPVVVTGQLWSAADFNTYLKANFDETPQALTQMKGDLMRGAGLRDIERMSTAGNTGAMIGVQGVISPNLGIVNIPSTAIDLIGSIVGNGSLNNATFSSIPQTYTHLLIEAQLQFAPQDGRQWVSLRFNDDSGANYASKEMQDSEETSTGVIATENLTRTYIDAVTYELGDWAPAPEQHKHKAGVRIVIPNYTSSFHKTLMSRAAWDLDYGTTLIHRLTVAGFWFSTAAINKIVIYDLDNSHTLGVGSVVKLYGVK